jgi:hypothetical protein
MKRSAIRGTLPRRRLFSPECAALLPGYLLRLRLAQAPYFLSMALLQEPVAPCGRDRCGFLQLTCSLEQDDSWKGRAEEMLRHLRSPHPRPLPASGERGLVLRSHATGPLPIALLPLRACGENPISLLLMTCAPEQDDSWKGRAEEKPHLRSPHPRPLLRFKCALVPASGERGLRLCHGSLTPFILTVPSVIQSLFYG